MPKRSSDFAKLRQTCMLGLPSPVLVPQILEQLHRIIDSDRIHFAWCDRLGNIVNGYFEKPDPEALNYFRDHGQQFQDEAGISVRQALLFGKATGNCRWPFKLGFENTDSYKALFSNLGIHHCIDGVVRDNYGPLAHLFLFRRAGDPDFDGVDEANLAQTLPYIAHAVSSKGTASTFIESGESALMVFDVRGRVTYQSSRAKELSFYALAKPNAFVDWQAGLDLRERNAAMEELFEEVRRKVDAYCGGFDLPAWTITNHWGEFQVRAYEMEGGTPDDVSFGVLLEKKTPMEIRLLERITALPLSTRQREVCFLLGRGVKTEDVAAMMSISSTTLKEHTQAVYRKLAVRNREDLIRLLLQADSRSTR